MKEGDVFMFKGIKLVATPYVPKTDEGPLHGPKPAVCFKCALRDESYFNTGFECPDCGHMILVTPDEAVTRKLLKGTKS